MSQQNSPLDGRSTLGAGSSKDGRERQLHPITKRFAFELDRERMVIVVFDKGIPGEIPLDALLPRSETTA